MTSQGPATPLISVVMANHAGAAHLPAAIRSVLDQTESRIELLLADDASPDDSLAVAAATAAGDVRLRLLPSPVNRGPAATRNRAINAARGRWLAVVDSDDLIHPDRLRRLVMAAEAANADMIADDLVHFGNAEARTLLEPLRIGAPRILGAADLLESLARPGVPSYGYLKPLIRRETLGALRYDVDLQIGEDHDLMVRLVLQGARFLLLPDPLYAYRRHPGSISHRMSVDAAAAMLAAHRALPPMQDEAAVQMARLADRQLDRRLRYERLVAAIKARRWRKALPALADPAMLPRLGDSLRDRQRRRAARAAARADLGRPPIPEMPAPGDAWAVPPAPAAAWIVAQPGLTAAQADLPGWARWLAGAVAGPHP